MQRWLLEIWGQLGATCLLVTHDIDEALLLADRIYVLTARPGRVRLEQRVPLERPRRLDMLARPEITTLKAELLAALVDEATEACKAAPPPSPAILTTDVYADGGWAWRN